MVYWQSGGGRGIYSPGFPELATGRIRPPFTGLVLIFPPDLKNTIMKFIYAVAVCFLTACQDSGDSPAKQADTTAPKTLATHIAPDSTSLGGSWYLQPVLASDT